MNAAQFVIKMILAMDGPCSFKAQSSKLKVQRNYQASSSRVAVRLAPAGASLATDGAVRLSEVAVHRLELDDLGLHLSFEL